MLVTPAARVREALETGEPTAARRVWIGLVMVHSLRNRHPALDKRGRWETGKTDNLAYFVAKQ